MKHTEIRTMRLRDLAPADYNPRDITPEALAGLKASLKRFGPVQTIVWNKRTRRIVGGHQRLKALLALGYKTAGVSVVDLPEAEEKALNLALNNPAIGGHFTDAVKETLGEIKLAAPELAKALRLDEIRIEEIEAPQDRPRFAKIAIPRPPKKVWVLLGIDAGKYQEVAGQVEKLQAMEGVDAHVKVE